MSTTLKHSRDVSEMRKGDPPHEWLKRPRLDLESESVSDPGSVPYLDSDSESKFIDKHESLLELEQKVRELMLKARLDLEQKVRELNLKKLHYEQDMETLMIYEEKLKANVPTVKTPFNPKRILQSDQVKDILSKWPKGVYIRDENDKKLDLEGVSSECDDCRVFGYGESDYPTTPLMYMVLGSFFDTYTPKTPRLDFQCYALSLLNTYEQNKIQSIDFYQSGLIKLWVERIMENDKDIFFGPRAKGAVLFSIDDWKVCRRCLIIDVYAKMLSEEVEGHVLVLMIEKVENGPIRVAIVDNLPKNEYLDSVHDYILNVVTDYISETAKIQKMQLEHNIIMSSIEMNEGMIKYESPLMQCMSVAYRACIYLSLVKDCDNIEESEKCFEYHREIFKEHMHRMVNWIHGNPQVQSQSRVPIVSATMLKPYFRLNVENCFLALARPLFWSHLGEFSREYIVHAIYESSKPIEYNFNSDGKQAFIRREDISEGDGMCTVSSRFGI